jgi:site-specific DNA-methyltransferase (adenine-specific)
MNALSPSIRVEQIGNATLYLGDCRDVLPQITSADALITDPPFGVGFKYASHDDRPDAYEDGYGAWLWRIIEAAEAILTPGAPVFIWQASPNVRRFTEWFPRDWRLFVAAKNFVQMRPTAMQWSYDPVIVWWKAGAKPWSDGTASRDFHIANTAPVVATPNNLEKAHPCPRPVDQMSHVVIQWCRPGGTVLDPFMGSGTTGVAAVSLGRSFVGIEKDAAYFDIARRRLEKANRQADLFASLPPAEDPADTRIADLFREPEA